MIKQGGFGVTFPLNAELAVRLARVLAEMPGRPLFVNACYPDAVNPLLRSLGLPVVAGVGNVAILAALVQASLNCEDSELHLLAHHVHVSRWKGGPDLDPPLGWLKERRIEDVSQRLDVLGSIENDRLNQITGATAVPLVAALLGDEEVRTHVPGPSGMPGGYPVVVSGGGVKVCPPPGMSLEQARAWNQRAAEKDGVMVTDGGKIEFTASAQSALEAAAPDLAGGFDAREFDAYCREFLALQARMRQS
jgi:hypothetical protein